MGEHQATAPGAPGPGAGSGLRLDPRGRRIVGLYAVVILGVVSWLAVGYFLESRFAGTPFRPTIRNLEPDQIRLGHWSCDADFRWTVEESALDIKVLLESRREGEDECGGGPLIDLDAPVGDRVVIDLHTGHRFRSASVDGQVELVEEP